MTSTGSRVFIDVPIARTVFSRAPTSFTFDGGMVVRAIRNKMNLSATD
jgi:hypothetical protein